MTTKTSFFFFRSAAYLIAAAVAMVPVLAGAASKKTYRAETLEHPDPAYPAQPAFFMIKDQDSVVYLLGSQHRIPKNTKWLTPQIRDAFFNADEIWFEITMQDSAHPIQSIESMRSGMAKDGQSLQSVLSEEEYEKVRATAERVGVDMNTLDRLQPWLAADMLNGLFQNKLEEDANPELKGFSEISEMKAGKSPKKKAPELQGGVEDYFDLVTLGRPTRSIENVEKHIMLFDNLPLETQRQYLMNTVRDLGDQSEDFKQLTAAWTSGDLVKIAKTEVARLKKDNPDYHRALLLDRNDEMVDRVVEQMNGRGVDFMVVGAAHLAGPDSVVNKLMAKGFAVTRLYDSEAPVATHDPKLDPELPIYSGRGETFGLIRVDLLPDAGKSGKTAVLRLYADYVANGCGEYLPIQHKMRFDGTLLEITAAGGTLFIAPPRDADDCGTPSKLPYVDIPISLADLREHGTTDLWLVRKGALDKFKVAIADGKLTLTPPEKSKGFKVVPWRPLEIAVTP